MQQIRRMRRHLRPWRGPWHVDATYIRVAGAWRYLYRAVDGTGRTIEFLLTAKRDKAAARRFFRRALGRDNTRHPQVIVTDRLTSYPGALRGLKRDGELWRFIRHRRGRWLNNRVERDHRRIKRRTRPMLGLGSFRTARRTLAGMEAMAMPAKGRVRAVAATDRPAQRAFESSVSPPERGHAVRPLASSRPTQQIPAARRLGDMRASQVRPRMHESTR